MKIKDIHGNHPERIAKMLSGHIYDVKNPRYQAQVIWRKIRFWYWFNFRADTATRLAYDGLKYGTSVAKETPKGLKRINPKKFYSE